MDITTNQKYISSTPRKLRLVTDMIRKMTPTKALLTLEFTQKYAALDLSKAIKTTLANAKQQGLQGENLTFKKIEINEGPKLKRFRAGTRGRAKPYVRKLSHIKIVLSDELGVRNSELESLKKKEKRRLRRV